VIEFDERRGMDLIGIFPSVIALRVALPFDQVLQGLTAPPSSMCADLLHLILLFSINQIRGRSWEVGAMWWCSDIGHQEIGVKHRVDTPLGREFELNCNWGDDFCDLEGAMSSRC
jgi:hypothetical protein